MPYSKRLEQAAIPHAEHVVERGAGKPRGCALMAADIVMPRLSDSMEEGTILNWMKSVGDEVAVGDELVEIETDKANMVYEADAAGTSDRDRRRGGGDAADRRGDRPRRRGRRGAERRPQEGRRAEGEAAGRGGRRRRRQAERARARGGARRNRGATGACRERRRGRAREGIADRAPDRARPRPRPRWDLGIGAGRPHRQGRRRVGGNGGGPRRRQPPRRPPPRRRARPPERARSPRPPRARSRRSSFRSCSRPSRAGWPSRRPRRRTSTSLPRPT